MSDDEVFLGQFIGLDPDTKYVACAILAPNGVPLFLCGRPSQDMGDYFRELAWFLGSKGCMSHYSCVEDQYISRDVKNPKNILKLGQYAGLAMAALYGRGPTCRVKLVQPVVWKKGVPKEVSQARILKRLGWGYIKCAPSDPYCIPKNPPPRFKDIK